MGNIAAFVLCLLIVAVVLEMVRRKKLREKYALLWLVVGLATLILAAWPELLGIVARLVGIALPSNLIFILSILLLLGVCLHLSWEISCVEDETRTLAEEVAILRTQVERLEGARGGLISERSRISFPADRTAAADTVKGVEGPDNAP